MLLNPCSIVSTQVLVGDVWLRIVCVWAYILIFVQLRGKIRVGEGCYEDVVSCKVQQVVRCCFLLPRNVCVCVCVP